MEKNVLFLQPVFTHNIWGGTKLRDEFGYNIDGNDIGECWGISAHDHGDCIVRKGQFEGICLSDMWNRYPELFGGVSVDRFPLLVKIIDAKDDLSIQVHPDDEYASKNENGSLGKTECWYILDCDDDATLVVGHNAMTQDELHHMVKDARWNEFIREIPIQKGDFIQINPGTVHAIKGGILLLETQQNSDITYRVYDYERLSNGKPRELHIQKSLDVIHVPADAVEDTVIHALDVPKNEFCVLEQCEYYKVFKLDIDGTMEEEQSYPFMLMSVVEGSGSINGQALVKGDHFIVPSGYGKMKLSGRMQIIASTI